MVWPVVACGASLGGGHGHALPCNGHPAIWSNLGLSLKI